jgi:hypothetical protein
MSAVGVTREFHKFGIADLQDLLELLPNVHQDILSLLRTSSFGILVSWDALADCSSPQSNPVEALSHIDHHAHHLIVIIAFERLANGCELSVEP